MKNAYQITNLYLLLRIILFNTFKNSDIAMELRKSMNLDLSYINKKTLKSIKSMLKKRISKLVTINSQLWLNTRRWNLMDSNIYQLLRFKSQPILKLITWLIHSTGEPWVQLIQLKINKHVDHAMHSQLSLPLKELISLQLDNFYHFQNNNSLIVTKFHWDAMEDGHLMPTNMLKYIQWFLKVNMHTLLKNNNARKLYIKD